MKEILDKCWNVKMLECMLLECRLNCWNVAAGM
jgi:hypothetical protein